MDASWHTSVITVANRSLISLCLTIGKPPLGHDSACSTEKPEPHTHLAGICSGVIPYRRQRASLKFDFDKENPSDSTGRRVSLDDAPFSDASSMDRLKAAVVGDFVSSHLLRSSSAFSFCPSYLILACSCVINSTV